MNNRNPQVFIRPALPADASTIAEYNCLLALETEGKTLDPNTIGRGVIRALNAPNLCRYYVAVQGTQIIGQTMVTYEVSDWRDGIIWWMQSVYVHQDFRNKGVFKKLYSTIASDAKDSPDARCIRLYVEQQNSRALATYFKLGMKDAGYKVLETSVDR